MKNFILTPKLKGFLKQVYSIDSDKMVSLLESEGVTPNTRKILKLGETDFDRNVKPEVKTPQEFLEMTKDEPNLTDQELQGRLEAFQSIKPKGFDWLSVEKIIRQAVDDATKGGKLTGTREEVEKYKINQEGGTGIKDEMVGVLLRNQQEGIDLPFPKLFLRLGNDAINDLRRISQEAVMTVMRQRPPEVDTTAGISRIGGIQTTRKTRAERTAGLESWFAQTPEELKTLREEYFKGAETRAQDFLAQEYVPQVASSLAQRGLMDSGEFGTTISAKAGEIQSTIEQNKMAQELADLKFFTDAGYKAKYQDLINANTAVAANLAGERSQALATQKDAFQKTQQSIQNIFDLDLFRQENEKALRAYRTQTEQKQSAINQQGQAQLMGQIFGNIAQAGTTAIMSKRLG